MPEIFLEPCREKGTNRRPASRLAKRAEAELGKKDSLSAVYNGKIKANGRGQPAGDPE